MSAVNELTAGFRLRWLGCACYEMDFGGLTVVSDPYITDNKKTDLTWQVIKRCDLITLSHTHYDHTLDIPDLMKTHGARLLCGELAVPLLLKWLDCNPMEIIPMEPDVELDFDAVKIQALWGQHIHLPGKASERVERANNSEINHGDSNLIELALHGDIEYRNYLYTLPNGLRMLVWGSDLKRPEQRNLLRAVHPDIAILQMTINSGEATARIAKEMGCKILLPHHFDCPGDYMASVLDLKKELARIAPEIRFEIPEYGKWIEL